MITYKNNLSSRLKHLLVFTLGISAVTGTAAITLAEHEQKYPNYKQAEQRAASHHSAYHTYSDNSDVWHMVVDDFKLPHYSNTPEVQKQIDWYASHPKYLEKIAKQATPYLYYIYHRTHSRGLPGELVLLPMIESTYDPFAYSAVGAAGLWQFMPGTASGFGIKQNWWYDGRKAIVPSTKAALDYLTYLDNFFNGNWLLGIAAYDSGEGTIQHAIDRNAKKGRRGDFWDLAVPVETVSYVPRLLALATIIENPKKYNVHLPPIPNTPYFTEVDVGHQIDLAEAAKMADMHVNKLYQLNPGYIRWATDPDGPYKLLIPVENAETFKANLASGNKHYTKWRHYKVQPGDTLGQIAQQHHTSVSAVRKVNHLTSDNIRVGRTLLIPGNTKQVSGSNPSEHSAYPDKKVDNHPGPEKTLYTVKSGDNLWSICKTYHVKPAEIRFWNKDLKGNNLKVGQKLVIWQRKQHSTAHTKAKPVTYTVKSGDNLSKIAKRHHTTVSNLRKHNHLTSDKLKVGQKLQIS
ncbi:MAG: lytic transglycosylase [Legionellales bacterium]|nr:lytic transglycosylase [Legionellales bacterium]